ncbi:hypothetical protein LTR66_016197, partial [Elasticomyces elasticus]
MFDVFQGRAHPVVEPPPMSSKTGILRITEVLSTPGAVRAHTGPSDLANALQRMKLQQTSMVNFPDYKTSLDAQVCAREFEAFTTHHITSLQPRSLSASIASNSDSGSENIAPLLFLGESYDAAYQPYLSPSQAHWLLAEHPECIDDMQ